MNSRLSVSGVARLALLVVLQVGSATAEPAPHVSLKDATIVTARDLSVQERTAVRVLVEAGAGLKVKDTLWKGTPLGWAEHYVEEKGGGEGAREYAGIAEYLRERE